MGQYIDKSNRVIRWSLITANLVSLAGCLLVVSVGIWTLVSKSFLAGLLTDRLFLSCAYIQLGAGILCLANSLFGCTAALKEVKSLLVIHTALSLLLLTVLVMAGVMAYIFQAQVEDSMKSQLLLDLRNYNPDPTSSRQGVTLAWDRTQTSLKCCGMLTDQVDHPWQVWKYNSKINAANNRNITMVPKSCCANCGLSNINPPVTEDWSNDINPLEIKGRSSNTNPHMMEGGNDNVWTEDCYTKGVKFLVEHSVIMAGVTLSVAASMVFGLILSIILFKKVR